MLTREYSDLLLITESSQGTLQQIVAEPTHVTCCWPAGVASDLICLLCLLSGLTHTHPPHLNTSTQQQASPELAAEASDGTDLVVFEGMGRGIETNLLASLTVDSLKLAMIKHPEVAACIPGGRLYDCVCKFDAAGADARLLRLTRADPAAAAQWN